MLKTIGTATANMFSKAKFYALSAGAISFSIVFYVPYMYSIHTNVSAPQMYVFVPEHMYCIVFYLFIKLRKGIELQFKLGTPGTKR
jgi:hypothetical protein